MRAFHVGVTTLATLALCAFAPVTSSLRGVVWAQEELAVGRLAAVGQTEGDRLRLRVSPGLTQPLQGTLIEGARVQIVEGPQTADGQQWFRVSGAAGSGWAAAQFLVAVDERAVVAAARGPLSPGARAVQMWVVGYNLSGAGRTATGTLPRWGTVAVDPQVIPLGTRLLVEGFEGTVFLAEDTGSAVRGNTVDIWFDDPSAARRLGTQTRTVTILER